MQYKIEELNSMLDGGMEVYRHYYYHAVGRDLGPIQHKMISPFPRRNGKVEEDPSFSIYYHRGNGLVFFKDHGIDKTGSHWQFVMDLYGLDFKEAVDKIKKDVLGLGNGVQVATQRRVFFNDTPKKSTRVELTPLWREWMDSDIEFFERFKISQRTLELFNCHPAYGFDIIKESKTIRILERGTNPIYCFDFPSGRHKFYRPFEPQKEYKWTSNLSAEEDIFGFHLVPKSCEHLFIIGGNKDAMSFYENIGYPVIALASESTNLTDSLISFMRIISQNIWVFYDNDDQGYRKAAKFKEQHMLSSVNHLLKPYNVKDFAQLVDEQPGKVGEFKLFLNESINKMNIHINKVC